MEIEFYLSVSIVVFIFCILYISIKQLKEIEKELLTHDKNIIEFFNRKIET